MTTTIPSPPKKTSQKKLKTKKDKMSIFIEKLKKMPDVRSDLTLKKYPKDLESHLYSVVADKILEELYDSKHS